MQPFSRTESKIKTMNKLTTKEAIEKEADKIYPKYSNPTKNDTYHTIWLRAANRVLEDMQAMYNAKFNLWELNAERDELITKLKEVLEWVEKQKPGKYEYNIAMDEVATYINSLLKP
jgi:hypothetical protein